MPRSSRTYESREVETSAWLMTGDPFRASELQTQRALGRLLGLECDGGTRLWGVVGGTTGRRALGSEAEAEMVE